MEIRKLERLKEIQLRFLLVSFYLGKKSYWTIEAVTRVSRMNINEITEYLSGKSQKHVLEMFQKGFRDLKKIQQLRPHLKPLFFAVLNSKIAENNNRKSA
jgi:hypothetical protein